MNAPLSNRGTKGTAREDDAHAATSRLFSVVACQFLLDLIAILLALGHEYHVTAKVGHHRSDDRARRRGCFSIFREEDIIKLAHHLARTKEAKISTHIR